MRIAAELFEGAVSEQNRAYVTNEICAVFDEQPVPFVAFMQSPEVIALAQQDDAGFVEQCEHVAAARPCFAICGHAECDMGFADSSLAERKRPPDQRVHEIVQVVGADDQFIPFDDAALEIYGAQGAGGRSDEGRASVIGDRMLAITIRRKRRMLPQRCRNRTRGYDQR